MPCCYLAADVAGYSRLIGAHEGGTLGELDFAPFLVALYFEPPQAAVAQLTFSSSYPLLSCTVICRG